MPSVIEVPLVIYGEMQFCFLLGVPQVIKYSKDILRYGETMCNEIPMGWEKEQAK